MRFQGLMKAWRRNNTESDLNDELRFHLEREVELNLARGMSAEEARRRALIVFGGVQQTRENVREVGLFRWAGIMAQDLRYAWRMLRKAPGFTVVAVLTLTLGIGMNTAIFSLIDAVLFRALPANQPEELVVLKWHARHRAKMVSNRSYGDCAARHGEENPSGCSFSMPFFNLLRSQDLFSGQASFAGIRQLNLSGNGAATVINNGQFVSGNFFELLGIKPWLGRTLEPADDRPTAAPVVMLGYAYWQGAFGGSPEVVGRIVRLNGHLFTIVGVAEPRFTGLTSGERYDVWLPLSTERLVSTRWNPEEEKSALWWLVIVGRLKPGVSAEQAQAALTLLYQNETIHGEKPYFAATDAPGIELVSARRGLEGGRKGVLQPLYLLMLAVALVLMIACANIAGLLLARATGRSKEIAVRLTLGASRGRLVLQLMMESLLLSATGGLLGLILARWGARGLMAISVRDKVGPMAYTPHLDLRVLAFTAAAATLTGVIFGLVPALRSLSVDIAPALKAGSGASDADFPRARWSSMGNLLVVGQVSLAIVALVIAGLLVRTLRNLKSVDLGFDSSHLLVFHLDPTLAGYKEGPQVDAMFRDLQERFSSLPGVTAVTYSWTSLVNGWEWDTDLHLPGTPENESANTHYMPVGPKFFGAMRIPFKAGRDFSAADFTAAAIVAARPLDRKPDPKGPPVAVVVNEAFVRRYFPHTNPLGQHLDERKPDDPSLPRGPGWDIIGVAGNARYEGLRGDISPTMYAASSGNGYFSVRTFGDPLTIVPAIRALISRKDTNLAMYRIATEEQQINRELFNERLVASLSSFFGFMALALACTGIYGLLAYEVTRRTREIGIRMAVGAQQRDVVRMVVRQGLLVAAAGAVIGAIASFAAKGVLETVLYKVSPGDPITLAAVATLLLAVALGACYFPARRATRVDPLVALRYE
ncbi:MAG TPA: ABC transporter permease [Candidatus Angelobacter sp.]|nr:ABC transporter permease [Candidatus Angelobacter sp.]